MNSIPDWAVETLMILGGLFFIYRGVRRQPGVKGVAWLTVSLGVLIAGAGLFFLIGEYVIRAR